MADSAVGPQLGPGELRQVLELLAERTGGAVFSVDRDCTVQYWSSSAERLLGPGARDVVGGHCLRGVRCAACLSGCAMERGSAPEAVEVAGADGRPLFLERHVYPTWGDDGSFHGGIELLVPVRPSVVPRLPEGRHRFGRIQSSDASMVSLFSVAGRLAGTTLPLHIEAADPATRGDLARAIHDLGPADEPFRVLDGAALRVADLGLRGGTLLLDDLPEVGHGMQLRLARTLGQSLGGGGARWVTASARPLELELRAGRIRAELAHVLLPGRLAVPALADRPDDLRAIVAETLSERSSGTVQVEEQAMELLLQQPWPGGATELRAAVGFAHAMGGSAITIHDLPPYLLARPPRGGSEEPWVEADVRRIRKALADADGNVARAAEALGVSRSTLWRRRRKYGV